MEVRLGDRVFSIERDVMMIESMLPVRNDRWRYVDAHGHTLTWKTVEWVTTETWTCQDCGEPHEEGKARA